MKLKESQPTLKSRLEQDTRGQEVPPDKQSFETIPWSVETVRMHGCADVFGATRSSIWHIETLHDGLVAWWAMTESMGFELLFGRTNAERRQIVRS